jgi:hypothetical protein
VYIRSSNLSVILRDGRLSDQTPPFRACTLLDQQGCLLFSTSSSSLSKISPHSLGQSSLHGAMQQSACPTLHSLSRSSPRVRPVLRCSLLAFAHRTPICVLSLLAPIVPLASRHPPRRVLVVPSCTSGRSQPSQGHPQARPCWWCSRAAGSHPKARINRP